ncbi:MAG: type I-E CRISPR-associated protein Cas6/Cse3/CasE, partial [Candidatus Caldarchaeum sp.]
KSMSPQEAARYRKTGPRRLLLTEEEKVEWLKRKGEENGFRILQCVLTDFRVDILKKDAPAVNVGATQFDGILEVTDPDAFHRALISGIGTQKGFGFGLLSIVSPPNPVTQEATE